MRCNGASEPMNDPMTNPYSPPISESPTSQPQPQPDDVNSLLPIGIWGIVALLGTSLVSPIDPIAQRFTLACGLLAFLLGVVIAAPLSRLASWGLVVLLSVSLALMLLNVSLIPLEIFFAASIAMGVWAARRITVGRVWIIGSFSAGFLIGCFVLGSIGAAVGAACAVYARSVVTPSASA